MIPRYENPSRSGRHRIHLRLESPPRIRPRQRAVYRHAVGIHVVAEKDDYSAARRFCSLALQRIQNECVVARIGMACIADEKQGRLDFLRLEILDVNFSRARIERYDGEKT